MKKFSLPARLSAAAVALTLTGALAACGEDRGDADAASDTQAAVSQSTVIEVIDPWVRATRGANDTSMTAAYLTLDNTGDGTDAELIGARTEVAGSTEIHEMVMVDGDMVMQELEGGLTVEAGKGQILIPGGNHLMLMEVDTVLAPGDEVDLVLLFADGSELDVTAPVKAFTEEEGHYHAPGTPEHTH